MERPARATNVEYVGGRILRVTFDDGLVRELDLDGMLTGVLGSLDHDAMFARARVDPTTGTVGWPGGIDLDPDVLHGDQSPATGTGPVIVREYRLQQS